MSKWSDWSEEDLMDMRYEDYLNERGCMCEQNDDCCCLSFEQFESEWLDEQEQLREDVI